MQVFHRAGTNAARRHVNHAQQGIVVVRVDGQAQVGQRVLDFLTLEKAQAAVDTVGHAGLHQHLFQNARLRVAAVQHRHVGQVPAVAFQRLDLVHDELRFFAIGVGIKQADLVAGAGGGPQLFAQAAVVALDQRVGRIQNGAGRAVVLLQPHRAGYAVIGQQRAHIAHFGATEGVDGLVVVAYGKQRVIGAGQQLEPGVLQAVGILKLVYQHKAETRAVVLAQRGIARQQLVAAQQQLGKIHHAFTVALRVVGGVQLDELFGIRVVGAELAGAYAGFFLAVDELLYLLGREFLVGNIQALEQAFDGALLLAAVQDLKGLRQASITVVHAQQAVAQAVEGAYPHGFHVHRHHGGQACLHFARGFVGKRYRQNAGRVGLAGLQQPGNARGQHPCFATTGASQHQRAFGGPGDGGKLFGVQASKQVIVHGAGSGGYESVHSTSRLP